MEQHGRTLAARHRPSEHSSANLLLNRLADNEALLTRAAERLTGASRQRQRITPAAEWLLDNFYLIEEQIRTPGGICPRATAASCRGWRAGRRAGLPRVYDIALEVDLAR